MNDLEECAVTALATRAALARPRADLAGVMAGAARARTIPGERLVAAARAAPPQRAEASQTLPGQRRPWWVAAAAAATIVAGAAGVIHLAGRSGGSGEPGWGVPSGVPESTAPPLSWATPHVTLAADQITIDYAGRTLTPPATAIGESEVISRTREQFSLRWHEQDLDIRWQLSFTMRDGEWWIDQMVVAETGGYAPGAVTTPASGPPPMPPSSPEVSIDRDGARMPLGEPLGGDVDVEDSNDATTARVRILGLRVLGFRDRVILPDGSAPIVPAAELPAAPPRPDDVRPTGMYSTTDESMALLVAQDELTRECMAEAGIEYPPIPDDVLQERLDDRASAAADGYHSGDEDGFMFGSAHGIPDNLPDDEQDRYVTAMGLDDGDGCMRQMRTALGDPQAVQSPMRAWDAIIQRTGQPYEQVRDQAYADPDVIAILDAWGQCMFEAVGERAANPDELMRMYAFADGDPGKGEATDHERAVAVADWDCQQQVDYHTVWRTAVVERERAAMGDRVGEYDQWVRDYQAMIASAQQVLDERGIVLPSLD